MSCPNCQSKRLDIRQPTGIESILIFLTNKRKFVCRRCERTFRAPDRRAIEREAREANAAERTE